jgi:tRNA(Arg) A34 adenosine deaminase TadA
LSHIVFLKILLNFLKASKKFYTTKKDDNFEKISESQFGDKSKWVLIYNMNKHVLPNPYVMEEGLTLYIPHSQEEIDKKFMQIAIDLAKRGMERNEGGPFGCIIVKDGQVIGTGNNRVTSTNDPTAHAEMVAIRDACDNIKSFQLDGCTVYTSCEPCPMCLGAIYWARPDRIVFACDRFDAANINFDDKFIYDEIGKPTEVRSISTRKVLRDEGLKVFNLWKKKNDKTEY